MSADKTLSWSYTEDFTAEDEATAQARIRGLELGITPVSSGTGAALRMLAASVGAKSVAEVGTGIAATVLLALVLDAVVLLAGRVLTPWMRAVGRAAA